MRVNRYRTKDVASANRNAFALTRNSPAKGTSPTPVAITSAAPKLAADEMPSVKGSASGLLRMVCICAPATPSIAPTSTAMTATGKRTFQMITSIFVPCEPGSKIALTTWDRLKLPGPMETSVRSDNSNIEKAAMTIATLRSARRR